MRAPITLALVALSVALAGPASAQMGGQPTDRLDWPGTPTDRYLDAEEVRTVLHAASEDFFLCFRQHARQGSDASDVGITFTIGRDGLVSGFIPELGDSPAELGSCLELVSNTLTFGDHDGDPFDVSYPLVYHVDSRGARILPYPVVFTRPRPVHLPLLELPADFTAGEIRMLELILTDETGAAETLPEELRAPEPASDAPPDEEPTGEQEAAPAEE